MSGGQRGKPEAATRLIQQADRKGEDKRERERGCFSVYDPGCFESGYQH